jgi:hypothetical protein
MKKKFTKLRRCLVFVMEKHSVDCQELTLGIQFTRTFCFKMWGPDFAVRVDGTRVTSRSIAALYCWWHRRTCLLIVFHLTTHRPRELLCADWQDIFGFQPLDVATDGYNLFIYCRLCFANIDMDCSVRFAETLCPNCDPWTVTAAHCR